MREYIKIFLAFAYIGAVSFGGGYAMLPMFKRQLVEKNGWLTEEEMTNMFSVAQCLPGIIAGNSAILVGYKRKGVLGGIVAALGAVFPSVVIIIILAMFISRFAHIPAVQSAFAGIRICVSVLIINTVIKLWKSSVVDKPAIAVFTVIFLLSLFTHISVAILIAAAGAAGLAISLLRKESSK